MKLKHQMCIRDRHQCAAAGALLQEDLGEAAEQGAQALQGRV